MKKNKLIIFPILILVVLLGIGGICHQNKKEKVQTKKMEATVLDVSDGKVTVQDSNHIIYTFNEEVMTNPGSNVVIEYTGLLNKNKSLQKSDVVNYKVVDKVTDENGVPLEYLDNGIFKDYYILANKKLEKMSLDEKINQLLLVQYPAIDQKNILKKYQFGGYLFFEKDLKDKTKEEVAQMMKELQEVAKVPILTAVDEEGGAVVRISSNPNLRNEKFKSSQELYKEGGFERIKEDTIEKSDLLKRLGFNVNLAPVVDVSTDPKDYMYSRSLGQDTKLTSDYAKTVIDASKNTGVSYTLKHFPGYGNNSDTHTGTSVDSRSLEDIKKNDLPPFQAGIDEKAEAVLVSHNTVTSIDKTNPASLSPSVHNLLRNELGFTGVVITDDLSMGAASSIKDAPVKALLAGNDLLIVANYEDSFNSIKEAVANGTVSEELIDKLAFRILAWKYYKGLMFEIHK